ncbi:glutamate receptor 2.8-like [Triticum dicoccoides]|uniref:glutamate receptor 2.8-like n=1 Tax=Triticum dicoccoides TaxID=85692 RepID=UPI001891EAF5|nr:glutamate receptor 2.8-like [Triticum dicoccoides]
MVRALRPSSLVGPSFFYALLLLVVAALVGQHPAGPLRVATAQSVSALAPVPVRVGVILDWATKASSAVSLRRRTGIQMAVEDYYAAHPGSATRVELHFGDSKGDVVGAASAALDLIKNAQVQAIIGPKTSAEAEFVAHIGSRAHVPVLSYSATSPSLSPAQTPYFVRTAAKDSLQATPVATVLAHFGWRAAVVLHEDSPYGTGILPALADALQSVDSAAIVERVAVPSGAHDNALDALLYRLKAMPTRVFVVHANFRLATRLFRRAEEAGMMSDGYAWVVTDGVGSLVDRLSPEDVDAMQGVVSLRPHVELTSQVKNFSARFRARFRRDNPASDDDVINDPTVTRLWSYDTAWAIAAAAEAASVPGPAFQTPQRSRALTDLDRLGVSATGAALLRAVVNTTFDGMAGRFKLVNGQLQVAAYEVVNIIGNGARTVGFWTPESGILRDLNNGGGKAARQLKLILWPGEALSKPRGWTESPNGRVLNVAVPMKNGFKQFVDVVGEKNSTTPKVTGYCIDVFEAVMKNLPYPVNYRYVPFPRSPDSYEKLVDQVSGGEADIAVGDVTITASRMHEADFTMPFTESGWAMVVATRPDTSASMWIFLQPLTTSLWLASLAFFCFTGFVVWVIEHRVNPEFRGTPSQQFGLIFYFSFSTLVFAHKEKLESNLSRLVVIIWVFVVLILTSSYTASLTSMLTVQQLRPTVTDVKELQRRGQHIGYQEGSFIEPLLTKMGFDGRKMKKYSTLEQYADALSKGSANGGVDAVFDEIPYLKLFLSQHCDGYMQVGPVYKTDGFGFVFPRGSPMVGDVSREILRLAEGDQMARIEKAWFGEPGTCRDALGGIGGGDGSSNLSFRSFGGLFLITGVVSSLMLLLYVAIFMYRERDELREAEAEAKAEAGSGSVPVRRLRVLLQHYDKRDIKSPTFRTWNDDSVRNGSDYAGRTPRWSGGDASLTPRAGGEEHAMGRASPLSVDISSEMNAGSSPEGTPVSEISESFEQRMEGAAAAVEMTRPTVSQLQ